MPLLKFILYYLKLDNRTAIEKNKEEIINIFRTRQCLVPARGDVKKIITQNQNPVSASGIQNVQKCTPIVATT